MKMKEYLKMADVFGGAEVGIRKDAPSLVDCCGVLAANCLCPETAEHIAHAINSHDELVQMNRELIANLCEINGCFEAALGEGWIDAVANKDAYRIEDICRRRIDVARSIAAAALSGFSV